MTETANSTYSVASSSLYVQRHSKQHAHSYPCLAAVQHAELHINCLVTAMSPDAQSKRLEGFHAISGLVPRRSLQLNPYGNSDNLSGCFLPRACKVQ